jgi:hypothetical protein
MAGSIRRRLLVSALTVGLAAPAPVLAWGPQAHQIVSRVADSRLSPRARAGIRSLIGDTAIFQKEFCNYADIVTKDRRETARWHFVDIPVGAEGYVPERDCPEGQCLVGRIDRFRKILGDPQAPPQVRVEALKYLVHLVADVHQPLHCATRFAPRFPNGDRGGNLYRVRLGESPAPLSLHRLWDETLVNHNIQAAVAARRIRAADSLEFAAFLLDPRQTDPARIADWEQILDPRDWAWESHMVAVKEIYANLPADPPEILPLGNDDLKRYQPVVDQQLVKAGVRLARLLNDVLGAGP